MLNIEHSLDCGNLDQNLIATHWQLPVEYSRIAWWPTIVYNSYRNAMAGLSVSIRKLHNGTV